MAELQTDEVSCRGGVVRCDHYFCSLRPRIPIIIPITIIHRPHSFCFLPAVPAFSSLSLRSISVVGKRVFVGNNLSPLMMKTISCLPMMMTAFAILSRPTAAFTSSLMQKTASRQTRTSFLQMVLAEPFTTSSRSSDSDNSVLDPLIVCGPSGVGKGTIIAKFMEELGGDRHFGFTVSHTTRAPRVGEVDGIHYHFVDIEDMRREVARGAFLEHAEVHGNMYGTSWSSLRDVQKKGKHCLLDIDVQGVQRVKTMETDILKPKYLFIAPPSLEILEKRLVSRGTESAASLAQRTQNAREEVLYGAQDGNFDAVVVNDSLEQAVEDFAAAVKELYCL